MGLIKAAILLGAGSYAWNKYNKSREEGHGHGCGCKHNRNRDAIDTTQAGDANVNAVQRGPWTPGARMSSKEHLPEYKDEKRLSYHEQERGGMVEEEGWSEVSGGKEGWAKDKKEMGA